MPDCFVGVSVYACLRAIPISIANPIASPANAPTATPLWPALLRASIDSISAQVTKRSCGGFRDEATDQRPESLLNRRPSEETTGS